MNNVTAAFMGFMFGAIIGMASLASVLPNYFAKIHKSENGYILAHQGKIYRLQEVKAGEEYPPTTTSEEQL